MAQPKQVWQWCADLVQEDLQQHQIPGDYTGVYLSIMRREGAKAWYNQGPVVYHTVIGEREFVVAWKPPGSYLLMLPFPFMGAKDRAGRDVPAAKTDQEVLDLLNIAWYFH